MKDSLEQFAKHADADGRIVVPQSTAPGNWPRTLRLTAEVMAG